ncbi:LysR substrate-binding domain-containing protein [Bradyrhizobium altum]|uniref:LysR substrate-binding domain-containing protein n=1 Tax=Bradyrhizobium altum TaxID=1571202 RepID=UPI001E4CBB74|nr:LysR substrate-binding domain-containing protein [Bradyrhizobium altum]
MYEHAGRSIEALVEAEQAVTSDQARLKGRLRLSLPQAFEPWWSLLNSFQHKYPEIQVQVYTTERRMDLIEDGIDVALRVGTIVHETMVARNVLSYRHILVANPQLVRGFGTPAAPHDLNRFPCAVWTSRMDNPVQWDLGGQVITPKTKLVSWIFAKRIARPSFKPVNPS